jgi:hypothetical protein
MMKSMKFHHCCCFKSYDIRILFLEPLVSMGWLQGKSGSPESIGFSMVVSHEIWWFQVSIFHHRIGWWENFNRNALYLMVKTMVSCRFSLKAPQWNNQPDADFLFPQWLCHFPGIPHSSRPFRRCFHGRRWGSESQSGPIGPRTHGKAMCMWDSNRFEWIF